MLRDELKRSIAIDKRMRSVNRKWTPFDPEEKRKLESENSSFVEFNFGKKKYKVIQEVDCTFSHPYYSMTIFENGVASRKGVRFLETVLEQGA